jgi:hypothetical protein
LAPGYGSLLRTRSVASIADAAVRSVFWNKWA